MDFFGGHERKTFRQIVSELITEDAACAGAGSVGFIGSVVENMLQKIKIVLH